MSGTSRRVVVPSASSAAAISLSTLFLAPVTRTSPASRAPPTTLNRSTPATLGGPAGQAADAAGYPVTWKGARIPSPRSPGLHAVTYDPAPGSPRDRA